MPVGDTQQCDGSITVAMTRGGGKKPHQQKRTKEEDRTTSIKFKAAKKAPADGDIEPNSDSDIE